MADAPYPSGWRKGVYPTQAFLDASIAHGELFLAELDGVLTGCMVLNHAYNDGYAAVTWAADVPDAQLLVHTRGRAPALPPGHRAAHGASMPSVLRARKAAAHCGSTCWAATSRPSGSTPAGFARRGTVRMFYADTGWTDYGLYEYLL